MNLQLNHHRPVLPDVTTARVHSRRRLAAVAAAGALSLVSAVAVAIPASASNPPQEVTGISPVDLPPIPFPLPITVHKASSPCFAVRTTDHWATDVGTQPRCTHDYGALVADGFVMTVNRTHAPTPADSAFSFMAMKYQMPAQVDSPCFMNPSHWDVHVENGVPICTTP